METLAPTPELMTDEPKSEPKLPLLLLTQPRRFAIAKDPPDLRAWEKEVMDELGTSISPTSETNTGDTD